MTGQTFTADEARQALLEAGREILAEGNSFGGVGAISFSSAISRSGVPRASAYRIFGPNAAQERFQQQLLLRVTSAGPGVDLGVLDRLIDDLGAKMSLEATSRELTDALAELICTSAAALSSEKFSSSSTGVYLAALASTIDGAQQGELYDALRSAELVSVDQMTDFVRRATDLFGLRMRSGLSFLDLGAAITSAISGALLTRQVGPSEAVEIVVGSDSDELVWTRLGVTLLGIVAMSTVSDPRRVEAADPSTWFVGH